ncbi:FecCD family ABC transporter permease [Syntrophomonas palmitatica]|uniref:FecCD family ABC transporter permease n=1 Tax=Syntrophomonas palmitatica TaxID=402877 RepID=UPI000A3F02AB|nr:iron ABC transporter permease [Syntrophomonas palmitatica]
MNRIKKKFIYALLIIGPLAFIFISLFIGRYPVPIPAVAQILWCKITSSICNIPEMSQVLIWDIRLPRAILGALVGGCLAVSGASFQGLFRNPLVSSGILGVTSGAGFGAALAILLFKATAPIYIFAFLFGGLAVLLSFLIGRVYNTTPTIMLVLGGTIVSSVFAALISFIKYVADPANELPSIVFWLMGSLASARYQDIFIAGIPMLIGIAGLMAVRWRINVLSMGDKEAQTLGINTGLNKGIVIICATLATAGAVCVSGIVGWIGLVVPHIGRMLVGNDNRILIPASLSLGACFLILIDNLGRMITGSEIPLGILTALVGGPFFVYLLKTTRGGGW